MSSPKKETKNYQNLSVVPNKRDININLGENRGCLKTMSVRKHGVFTGAMHYNNYHVHTCHNEANSNNLK